jgi:alkylation response protein AidB-like acyl-CoA dehydrogenase
MSAQYGGAGLTTEELARANIGLSQCSVAFRRPIAEYQFVQAMLADCKVEIDIATRTHSPELAQAPAKTSRWTFRTASIRRRKHADA